MKQLLTMLGVAAVAAAITYLVVVNQQTEERAKRLAQEVAAAEERAAQLEEELHQSQERLRRMAESPPAIQVQNTTRSVPTPATRNETPSAVSAPSTVSTPVVVRAPTAVLPVAVPVSGWSSDWIRYEAQPGGSSCTVEGTSSLQDWRLESPVIGGAAAVHPRLDFSRPASILQRGETTLPCQLNASIPVRTLKSYNIRMDEIMQQHMEESRFKKIDYRLIELTVRELVTNSPPSLLCHSRGELVIHGVTNLLEMRVTVTYVTGSRLQFSGSTSFKMTDFGVQPPVPTIPGLPAITTGDEVKITFTWILKRASGGGS